MVDSRHRSIILLLCCLAQFIVVLDVAIVNVALPSMSDDLEFTSANLHWVVNAYSLAFAGLLLLGGRAGDLLGRREVFIGGLLLFAAASLAGGVAQSKEMLIGARALQGAAAAFIAPTSLAILMTTFTEGAERNRALGMWGAVGGIGGASGGLIGGLLTDTLSWRWVLLINVPICLAVAVGALRYVRHVVARGDARRRADVGGAVLITAGVTVLTYGIVGTETHGWGSARTLLVLGAGLALVALFIVVERWVVQDPLVPLRIFRSRAVSGSGLVVFCVGASGFSLWYILSLYSQNVLGYTALEAGLMFLPMTLVLIAAARIGSSLCGRIGAGTVLAGGLTLLGFGLLWLTRMSSDGTFVSDLLAPTLLCGAGMGAAFVSVTVSATTGVAGPDSGLASALVNVGRQIGGSLGLALLSAVAASHTAGLLASEGAVAALSDGYAHSLVIAMAFAFAGALISAFVLRDDRGAKPVSDTAGVAA